MPSTGPRIHFALTNDDTGEESTLWFNRVLNIVTEHAPGAKFVLVRSPDDALAAIERVVGRPYASG